MNRGRRSGRRQVGSTRRGTADGEWAPPAPVDGTKDPTRPIPPSDRQLLQLCREGDADAFAVLFRRYHDTALRIASVGSTIDAEDLAAEAFSRIWSALRDGGGPRHAFLPYLKTTLRNVAATWGGRSQEAPTEDDQLERAYLREVTSGPALDDTLAEQQLISEAFASLPERWQTVLWMTEVEGRRASEVASELGLTPNSAAALTKRARDALSRAWLQAQVDAHTDRPDCQWVLERVGAYVRRSLSKPQAERMRAHLDDCVACTRVVGRITHLGASLRLVALVAGGSAAGLAHWSAGSTPAQAAVAPGPVTATTQGVRVVFRQAVQAARHTLTTPVGVAASVVAVGVTVAAVAVSGLPAGSSAALVASEPQPVASAPRPVQATPSAATVALFAADVLQPAARTNPVAPAEPAASAAPTPSGSPAPRSAEPADPVSVEPARPTVPAVPRPTQPAEPEPSAPAEPQPTGPTEPGPTAPAEPTEPSPTTPAEPEPAEPAEPEPTEPTDPEPTDPEPTDPEPTEPVEPTEPGPAEPTEPTDPEPTEPEPTDPAPTEPTDPAEPEPTEPTEPTDPEPTEPADPGPPKEHCIEIGGVLVCVVTPPVAGNDSP